MCYIGIRVLSKGTAYLTTTIPTNKFDSNKITVNTFYNFTHEIIPENIQIDEQVNVKLMAKASEINETLMLKIESSKPNILIVDGNNCHLTKDIPWCDIKITGGKTSGQASLIVTADGFNQFQSEKISVSEKEKVNFLMTLSSASVIKDQNISATISLPDNYVLTKDLEVTVKSQNNAILDLNNTSQKCTLKPQTQSCTVNFIGKQLGETIIIASADSFEEIMSDRISVVAGGKLLINMSNTSVLLNGTIKARVSISAGYKFLPKEKILANISTDTMKLEIDKTSCVLNENKQYCDIQFTGRQVGADAIIAKANNIDGDSDSISIVPESPIATMQLPNYSSGLSNSSCFIDTSSNSAYCWGQNMYGQLGIGNNKNDSEFPDNTL